MIFHIVAGGPVNNIPDLKCYDKENTKWIGVDRGTVYLINQGIIPVAAVGDFDSITEDEWCSIKEKNIDLIKYKAEKDATDLELALKFAYENNPCKIRIFGATGGRLDHFLAGLHHITVLQKENPAVPVCIIDKKNIIEIKLPGTYQIETNTDKQFVSFLPLFGQVKNLTLEGFKYPLKNRHISYGSTLCISNELICDYVTYSFSDGILLVIRSVDD